MAFYKKVGKGKTPGTHPYTNQDMRHVALCMRKGIKIAVQPRGGDEWEIEITINKSINLDPKSYKCNLRSSTFTESGGPLTEWGDV